MQKAPYLVVLYLFFSLFTFTSCTTDDIDEDMIVYQEVVADTGEGQNPPPPPPPPEDGN